MKRSWLPLLVLALLAVSALSTPVRAGEMDGDLQEVFENAAYHRWQRLMPRPDDDRPSWLERWLEDWLRSDGYERERPPREPPRPRPARPSNTGSTVSPIIAIGLGALAAIIILYAQNSFWKDRTDAADALPEAEVGAAEALDEGDALAMDDAAWSREAARRLQAGEIRLAYRSLYLGLLSGLHAQGRIVFSRNRTNWHYVDHMRRGDPERERFADMTRLFDQVWYGHTPALDQDGLDQLSENVRAILGGETANV